MATSKAALADALAAGRFTELRRRLFFLLGAIIVFRIGSFITVPGLNTVRLAELFEQQQNTILGLFNMFTYSKILSNFSTTSIVSV